VLPVIDLTGKMNRFSDGLSEEIPELAGADSNAARGRAHFGVPYRKLPPTPAPSAGSCTSVICSILRRSGNRMRFTAAIDTAQVFKSGRILSVEVGTLSVQEQVARSVASNLERGSRDTEHHLTAPQRQR
jgi:hypothetical protein